MENTNEESVPKTAVFVLMARKTLDIGIDLNECNITYESRYHPEKQEDWDCFFRRFEIDIPDGTTYQARIWHWLRPTNADQDPYFVQPLLQHIVLHIKDADIVKARPIHHLQTAKYVSEEKYDGEVELEPSIEGSNLYIPFTRDLELLRATLYISIFPKPSKLTQEKWTTKFTLIQHDLINKPKDFKLEAEGHIFEFNRASLATLSPVFKHMFEECTKGSRLKLDCKAKEIRALCSILNGVAIQPTVDLMEFADKYEIIPLFELSREFLIDNIEEHNMFSMARFANMTNDKELLKKVANSFRIHKGKAVQQFLDDNPECSVNLIKVMME